jgi:hypothetical protein
MSVEDGQLPRRTDRAWLDPRPPGSIAGRSETLVVPRAEATGSRPVTCGPHARDAKQTKQAKEGPRPWPLLASFA